MSYATSSIDPKNHLITPEVQLNRIAVSSPLYKTVNDTLSLISDLTTMIALYALDSQFTDWYTSLREINRLPIQIREFPDIHAILNKPCPKEICDKTKSDNSFYTVGEKCTLMLVPEELGTVGEFEEVIKAYGETQYPEEENPLQFHSSSSKENFKDLPSEPTHLVLHTNDVLENSQEKTYEEQASIVASFAEKTQEKWEITNFRDLIACIFLKKIATQESLFPKRQSSFTFTRVKILTNGVKVIVGRYGSNGLPVLKRTLILDDTGTAALWRLGLL